MLNDDIIETKGKKIKQKTPNIINIKKIRKDLNLYYNSPIINEAEVIERCVNRMEKLLKKKDIEIMLQVAKSVLMQDRLANNQYNYNYIFENITRKIIERKMAISKRIDKNPETITIPTDTDYFEKTELKNLFKDKNPDFSDNEYLQHLKCKYNYLKYKLVK